MDRLQAMGIFVAVSDLRGFAPAARRLRVSPSVVTRAVAGLEEHLGARLLQRTTRSVTLTDAGARYLERARRILADVEEAERAAESERSAPSGRFHVAAPQLFGRLHVAPLMCAFLAKYPAVRGELTLADGFTNLVEEGVDLAVRIGALSDSSLVVRQVGATRRVVVGSPSYLKKHRVPRTPLELGRHALIQFTSLARAPEWSFVDAGRELRVPFSPSLVTNSGDAALGHAELGGGLTSALAYQVRDAVREGRLQVVLAEYEPPPLPIHVTFPTTRLLSAKVRAFVDLLTRRCDWRFLEV